MDERIRKKMKTYKHLYEEFISEENIKLAIRNGTKKKRHRPLFNKIYNNQEKYVPKFQEICKRYYNRQHKPKEIYDGITRKKRIILVPAPYEQIVHHMVVNILKPIFMKSMYEYSCGSIPKRGGHMAKKHIQKWIYNDIKNTKYCLKMDIRKYFESIPHDILKAKLSRIILDKDFLKVVNTIIDVQEIGLPLGFYTSQWLANFYLTDLDHFIKEELCAKYYVRYMDDMVILGGNKRQLHKMRQEIEKYLNEILGLQMKDNWQVFKIEYVDKHGKTHGRALDFMGFKFYRNRTTLRRNIMLRASKKAKRIKNKDKPTLYDCRQMLSYTGWISATDTYGFYKKYIKPYVNIRYMKKRISKYERRSKLCGKQ